FRLSPSRLTLLNYTTLSAPLFLTDTPSAATRTLSLHDALPIFAGVKVGEVKDLELDGDTVKVTFRVDKGVKLGDRTEASIKIKTDRKSTRLNSSHVKISYAVFCLKKKKNQKYKCTYTVRDQTPD